MPNEIIDEQGGANPNNDAGAFAEAITKSLAEEEKLSDKSDEIPKSQVETEGYKGAERRAAGYQGEKRRAADKVSEDPEYEMDFELEPGKGKHKFKLSDLKQTASWVHANKETIQGQLKLRELATKHPEFGKLINEVITKSFNEKGELNSEFVIQRLKSLDAKSEAIEEDIEDKDDEIKKAEELLKSDEIDPDSVQAKVLRSNIAAMKAQKANLNKALDKITEISKRFETVEKGQKDFLTKHEEEVGAVEVKRLSGVFNKTFGAMTDPNKQDGFKFIDEDEAKDFEKRVREMVSSGAADIKDDEGFVKLIQDSVKAVWERTSKLRESAVNDYLRSKGKFSAKQEDKSADAEIIEMQKQLSALEKDGKEDTHEAERLRAAIKAKKEFNEDPLKGKTIGESIAEAMFASS
jgi:hypothetical protein